MAGSDDEDDVREERYVQDEPEDVPDSEEEGEDLLDGDEALPMGCGELPARCRLQPSPRRRPAPRVR